MINLTAGDIAFDESAVFYRYVGKGGVRGRRELPGPAHLGRHRSVARRCRQGPLFHAARRVPLAGGRWSQRRLQRYLLQPLPWLPLEKAGLPPSGVHVLRHTAAKLRRDVGESVESVSQFLDHSSLAVTTTYLRRLEGERDTAWHGVASVIGVS